MHEHLPGVVELTAERIRAIEERIRPYIRTTPVLEVRGEDFGARSHALALKLELCQHAGSFKVRGAFAHLLTRELPAAGVAAASGGNHGLAVAYAAQRLGVPARIFVPTVASQTKIDGIRACGATLVVEGDRYADALELSEHWVASSGAMAIHAYDQIETLLGQATLGTELQRQAPQLDTLLVAVGGGGLIGGVAASYADRISDGTVRIIGVEPEAAPTLTLALQAGHPVDSPAGGVAADSLAPRRVGALMLPLAQHYVADVVRVSDEAITGAQRALWNTIRIATEPGGAAAMAALTSGRYVPRADERIGVVICGGNTTAVSWERSGG
jgi:threonine dehydratase